MTALAAPIDPLSHAGPGHYRDPWVDVARDLDAPPDAIRTASFALWSEDGRIHVRHGLSEAAIDNDIAAVIAAELFAPGLVEGGDLFERVVTGIVVSSASEPVAAWERFYRNTLDRLADLAVAEPISGGSRGGHVEGSLADYAPVYAHARALVGAALGPHPTAVLELGSCFGFFSLILAADARVTASDVTPNTMGLLSSVAGRLQRPLRTVTCDAADVPRPDSSFDTVVALHLLEHLRPDHGRAVVAEMQRLARYRVVVAVPFEDEPTAAYGHLRTFTLADLAELGRASGWDWQTHEHHGGWLVLDRPSRPEGLR